MKKNDGIYLIGIDIGGTKCAASLGRADEARLEVLSKRKIATAGAPETVLDALLGCSRELLAERGIGWTDIAAIGISCGGPLDSKRGIIKSPPNLPGWDNIEVCGYFAARTGCTVSLQNDANACAVAEWKFGAGRGTENMIFLTFGTGFGAGLILDGRLYSGKSDNAGEIGHVRLAPDGPEGYGKRGSAEGFCSGRGIAALARAKLAEARARGERPLLFERAGEDGEVTAKLVAELAREGDALCRGVYDECAEKLGAALALLMDIIDPELIVIGSIYARDTELLRDISERVIRSEALSPCPVVPAGLGEQVGDLAALSVAYSAAEVSEIAK